MKKRTILLIAVVMMVAIALTLFGCTAARDGGYQSGESDSVDGSVVIVSSDRKIVYEVDLYLYLKDPIQSANRLRARVEELGGYVQNADESVYDEDSVYNTYVFRVPTAKLNDFLSSVEGEGKVRSKNVSTIDVTTEYLSQESHIESLRSEKEAFEALLENATEYEDIIKIRQELTDIDYQLSYFERQKAILDNRVDYSKVTVNVRKEQDPEETVPFGQQMSDLLKGSFRSIGTVAKALVVVFVAIFPYLLLAGVIAGIVIGIRVIVRKKKGLPAFKGKKKIEKEIPEEYNFDPETGKPLKELPQEEKENEVLDKEDYIE